MSLLSTLQSWEHTFTAWAAKEYQAFRNEEPTIVALADRVFPYVKSAIQIAIGFESPAVAVAAGALLDKIHAEVDTASGLLYDFGANPTVQSSLATIQNDIGSLESVAGIKSQQAKDAVAKALSSVQALAAAVAGAIAAAAPPAAPAAPGAA
jgi:hypothetical protein